ncbi:hypothetical protein Pcinc_041651 [Petrolisthes cinctipes]|uniref:Protein kinase domain-containing protein n=1 Tax=Petrolisthes cinctipes TaxID=88211 RepID=A0AAE1BJ38_PETCI|nr:hypothetical protein Pcinc_041651 [Petrolisthes cinctipes]
MSGKDEVTSADLKALLTRNGDALGPRQVYNWCRRSGVKLFTPDEMEGMLGKGRLLKIGEGTYGVCYRLSLHGDRDWVLKRFHGEATSDMLLKEVKALDKVKGVKGV